MLYEVSLSKDGSFLVTGNIKHFPQKSFATLSEAEARIIRKDVPMNVSETDLSYARYKLPSSEVVSRYYYCRDSLAE